MYDKVTSHQVAELAGVSQSAVSRVFTPGASVSKKTAAKVRAAADELGYRPNVLARAMVSGKSRIIGVIVAYLENQFYTEVLEKLSRAFKQRGYHILIFMVKNDRESVEDVMADILDYQVDGIVMASIDLTSDIVSRCRNAGVPLVLFNRSQDIEGVTSITSDNIRGGEKVASYLVEAGYRKLAYIAGWEKASTQRDREQGFRQELTRHGHQLFARETGNFSTQQAQGAARRLFDNPAPNRPDAVFVANDHMAFAVMDVIRFEYGLRVPEDVAVVGYDDVPPASWGAYSLTTVRQRANLMVEETAKALFAMIDHPEEFTAKHIKIDGDLIVRRSSRALR
ncbi:LacI family DNA-binding transcriptional regulator [Polycladidibacter hongkongensis]|uniref:LacI family DNA-binding transcriptional regulator n=1 Tax=Polycladidibacter hongkongensis TaxID=1647556 RepID=UPI0008322C07|nr:LacI family DNA-binding transcriptional regulator [Pseudovibrio hongkongensis]